MSRPSMAEVVAEHSAIGIPVSALAGEGIPVAWRCQSCGITDDANAGGASLTAQQWRGQHVAAKLAEAGYGELPRIITTVEELDALTRGAVVGCLSHMLNLPVAFVFQRGSHNGMGWGWTTPDTAGQIESADVFEFVALNGYAPIFTVLFDPSAVAAR